MPIFVTLTGADSATATRDIVYLDRGGAPPWFVEMAVLISFSRAGTPRYPTLHDAQRILEATLGTGMRAAIHLCGAVAKTAFSGHLHPDILDHVRAADRIQVNGNPESLEGITYLAALWPEKTWILQTKALDFPPRPAPNVTWLFDQSAGTGIAPKAWPPHPGFEVGYAGGIGPGRIPEVSSPSWIDMESSLRDEHDRFSFEIAKAVMVEAWSLYSRTEKWV